jgi:hypothetical protein
MSSSTASAPSTASISHSDLEFTLTFTPTVNLKWNIPYGWITRIQQSPLGVNDSQRENNTELVTSCFDKLLHELVDSLVTDWEDYNPALAETTYRERIQQAWPGIVTNARNSHPQVSLKAILSGADDRDRIGSAPERENADAATQAEGPAVTPEEDTNVASVTH